MTRPLVLLGVLGCLTACATSSERAGFEEGAPEKKGADESPAPPPPGDFGKEPPPPPGESAEISEVFGHSKSTLYRLDPKTKAVKVVGDFADCKDIIDIALDEKSTLYAASYDILYR